MNNSNEVQVTNYISIETKKNQEFQNYLSNMTRADAQHDIHILKNVFKENANILKAFSKGLPTYPSNSLDEDDCMEQIFLNQNKKLDAILEPVPNVTENKQAPISYEIGFNKNTLHNYTCVKFVIASSTNKSKNLVPASGDIASNFCLNTDLCGASNNAIFVVDFNQHGFLSIFKEGKSSSLYNIHYIMSPEVVNDPAGKTSIHDSIFTSKNTGVLMNSYVQTSVDNTIYTKYDPNNIGANNNFFTNYNFNLSPIQKIYTKQKAEKLITNLKINWNNDKGQPFTCDINDSKGENSNATVLGYIKKIIQKMSAKNDDMLNFNLNTKCQQKRGGDWFQALSCLNIYNREFTNMQNVTQGSKAFPSSYPVYFVSHDRIAVSFALLMGVNVIYLDYYGQVYVFKNQQNEATKSSGKSYEEGLFEMLQEKSASSTGVSELSKYLTFNKNYNVAREDLLNKTEQDLMKLFSSSNKTIESIPAKDIKNYQKTTKDILQSLFSEIVKYHFMNTNLLDTSEDVSYIEKNQQILQSEYNEDLKEQVLQLYKAYNRIYGVYTQQQGGSKDLIESSLLLWSNNVNKLDIYRSAKNILNVESYQDKQTFDMRLLNYNTNTDTNEKRANDIYIFLPYIQTVNDSMKTSILDFINGPLLAKTLDYKTNIQTGKSVFRFNRLSPNEVFFNQVANFIYEIRIFISLPLPPEKSSFVKSENYVEPFEYLSTDKIVVAEDLNEINLLKGEGKVSNTTDQVIQDEPPNPVQLGGFAYYEKQDPSKKTKNDVINDISIKQITWPLLTNLLVSFDVNNVNKNKIQQVLLERENIENLKNGDEENVVSKKRKMSDDDNEEENEQNEDNLKKSRIIGGDGSEVFLNNDELNNLLENLYDNKSDNKGDNKSLNENKNESFLTDSTFGYHPLLPIYMILTSMWYFIEPTLADNSFYYTYIAYLNCMEKMIDILINNYLNDPTNNNKVLSAYFIGFSLKPFLFTLNCDDSNLNSIIQMLNIELENYRMYSLKNDMFSNNVAGHIIQSDEEKDIDLILLKSELFKNYIMNEVQLDTFIKDYDVNLDKLPTTEDFQERVYQLMSKISNKITNDRISKSDLEEEPKMESEKSDISSISSSTSSSLNKPKTKKIIDKQGNIVEVPIEPKKTGVYTLNDYQKSSPTSSSSNVYVTSSTNSSRTRGGKSVKKSKKLKHKKTLKKNGKKAKKTLKKNGKKAKKTLKH